MIRWCFFFFFSSRRRHTRYWRDWSSDVCSSDLKVVVFFYGGRWESGDRGDYLFAAQGLVSQGFVAVVPDYRLHPEVGFAGFMADGAAAVRWVRDNIAGFGGDPAQIFLMGHSAGAHIAALLALDERWLADQGLPRGTVRGAIGLAGPYDFLPLSDR